MKWYKNLIGFVVVVFSINTSIIAQEGCDLKEAKIIVNKVKTAYDTTSQYSVDVEYTMFDGADSTNILEQYSGTMIRRNNDFYSKIHHTESLQIANEYIRVNHQEKAILYAVQKEQNTAITGVNLEGLFKNFEKATLTENSSGYKITFMAPPISQSPYNVVVLEIDKHKYRLKKQTLFFSGQIPIKTASGVEKDSNPRLEIVFNNFSTKETIDTSRFQLSSYMNKKSKDYKPSGVLKNYQFIDTTIQ